jgi:hypothetical protein
MTRGEWDIGQTPKISMQGINASSICDLMLEAKFIPGNHITPEFLSNVGVPANFGIPMQFHIQRGVEVFKGYKRQLPEDVRKELAKSTFCLADPAQAEEGDDVLLIHGIIGEDMINEIDESVITKVGKVGMKVTRSLFGDLVHGRSHYISFPYNSGGVRMKDDQDFSADRICQFGIYESPLKSEGALLDEVSYLRSICD